MKRGGAGDGTRPSRPDASLSQLAKAQVRLSAVPVHD